MSATKPSSIVTKCNQVLDLIAASSEPLGFSDIVNQSGLVKSSAHRILSILQHENLVSLDSRSKRYGLGPRLMLWAQKVWQGSDIQQAAFDELDALARTSAHNVALAVADESGAVYLRTVNNYELRYVAKAGERAALHCTAVGKVLLAFTPTAQREAWFKRLELTRFSENTIVDRNRLVNEISKVNQLGYAVCDGEEFLQVCGIAAPVFDFQNNLAGSVCIWSLRERADLPELKQFIPQLIDSTQRISGKLGQVQRRG